jgi:hypothetical protein
MPEPTKTLSPTDIVGTLLDGAPGMDWELHRVLPGGEKVRIPYRMQVLRVEETRQALKGAQDEAKARGELKGYGDIYNEAQVDEILVRAMRHPEKRTRDDGTSYYPPVFVDASQLRSSLTEMDMAALLNAYEITKRTFAVVDGLEKHDAESWIARLSDPLKGPFNLSLLDSHHWPSCISLLAGICRDLYQELGRELPNSEPSSAAVPENSTSSTISSGTPPVASTTACDLTVPGDKLLNADEARELVKNRKGE